MARDLDPREWRHLLGGGARTGKLATTRSDGRPHIIPLWFVLDNDEVVFVTEIESVKGKNLRRDGRAALCVDDERPPYAFVVVEGEVTTGGELEEMYRWLLRIGERYLDATDVERMARANAVPEQMLVRLKIERVFAQADLL